MCIRDSPETVLRKIAHYDESLGGISRLSFQMSVAGLPGFDELVEKLFFELMDGKLATVEEMKAYLEPFSPPAPPPPVHLRRARATKKDAKVPKARKKAPVSNALEGDTDALEIACLLYTSRCV